jgi:hypothetical protein
MGEGRRSYNHSSIKKTKPRKNSVFSIYSNGMQHSSVSKDSNHHNHQLNLNGPAGRNQHLKLEKVKTDVDDQQDYTNAPGSGSKKRKGKNMKHANT